MIIALIDQVLIVITILILLYRWLVKSEWFLKWAYRYCRPLFRWVVRRNMK